MDDPFDFSADSSSNVSNLPSYNSATNNIGLGGFNNYSNQNAYGNQGFGIGGSNSFGNSGMTNLSNN